MRSFIVMGKDTYFSSNAIQYGEKKLFFDRPLVLGILNVTPDSFYDGGRYLTESQILSRTEKMLREGADILDVGVVSSRPGAQLLPPDEEAPKLENVVGLLRKNFPEAWISVDTCFSLPAQSAVEAGADMVNDISGGQFDSQMFPTVARLKVPYVLMHTNATPDRMQVSPSYVDVVSEVGDFFERRLALLKTMGVEQVILDPGFGFGKTLEHNYQLLNVLPSLCQRFPDNPFLVAASRKSMIYRLLDTTPEESLSGTIALSALALDRGARLLRVHDVLPAVQTVKIWQKTNNPAQ